MSDTQIHRAYVALGSNLADPATQIHHAFELLARLPQTRLIAASSLYASAPVGYADQPDFINAAAKLDTGLSAHDLLESLLALERTAGRVREFRNAPRTLDLDLLLYDDLAFHETGLTLPHPRMHERAFVLLPLVELDAEVAIPGKGLARDWLASCADQPITRVV